MKKKTLLGVAAAARPGGRGLVSGRRRPQNQIEHIRREAKRLLAVRRDELAALRSAAEAGGWTPALWGRCPWTGRRWSPSGWRTGPRCWLCGGEGGGLAVQRAAGPAGCTPCPGGGAPAPACSTPNIWAPAGTRATPAWGGADMLRIRGGHRGRGPLRQEYPLPDGGHGDRGDLRLRHFKDKERLALLRRLAEKRGLIVLTDPDGAGFVIRSHP